MAATAITNTALTRNTAADLPTNAAIDATDGALITAAADQKMLIILEKTTGAGDITIAKGNGVQGVADKVVTFWETGTKVIAIESGKYVNVSGDLKGKIKITGVGKVSCIVLP